MLQLHRGKDILTHILALNQRELHKREYSVSCLTSCFVDGGKAGQIPSLVGLGILNPVRPHLLFHPTTTTTTTPHTRLTGSASRSTIPPAAECHAFS